MSLAINVSTTFPDYQDTAVGKWFWAKNHPCAGKIDSYKLTINQGLDCSYQNNSVSFLFKTCAVFNDIGISNDFNEGPYIDILKCAFTPLNDGCDCLEEDIPSTPIKSFVYESNTSNNKGVNARLVSSFKSGAIPQGELGANCSEGKNTGIKINKHESNQIKLGEGKKRIVTLVMNTCYSRRRHEFKNYDIEDLSTMRGKHIFKRCSMIGSLLTAEWFDTMRRVPDNAKSSIGINLGMKFSFTNGMSKKFEWSTEVRTVFVSNDNGVYIQDAFHSGQCLNWITTVHRIIETFEVRKIDYGNKVKFDIQHLSTKKELICETGYEKTTRKMLTVTNTKIFYHDLDQIKYLLQHPEKEVSSRTYNNRDKYDGNLVDGKRHGLGIFTFANGDKYEGCFVEDKFEGKGKFTFINGNIYEGDFVKHKFHGKGTYTYSDGRKYIGYFVDGLFHGQGSITFEDGAIYVGNYVAGKHEGLGRYTYVDASEYVGQFVDNKFHGQGTLTFANGDVYVGNFVAGNREGYGTYNFANGDVYDGNFVAGNRKGFGTYKFANSDKKYAGIFFDGKFPGINVVV